MTKTKINLVKMILENTVSYRSHYIEYQETLDDIRVWSKSSAGSAFQSLDILQLLTPLCSTYMTYDEETGKCVLVIF